MSLKVRAHVPGKFVITPSYLYLCGWQCCLSADCALHCMLWTFNLSLYATRNSCLSGINHVARNPNHYAMRARLSPASLPQRLGLRLGYRDSPAITLVCQQTGKR
jgi:hypothetical protein